MMDRWIDRWMGGWVDGWMDFLSFIMQCRCVVSWENRMLGGLKNWCELLGAEENLFPWWGIEPWTVQPAAQFLYWLNYPGYSQPAGVETFFLNLGGFSAVTVQTLQGNFSFSFHFSYTPRTWIQFNVIFPSAFLTSKLHFYTRFDTYNFVLSLSPCLLFGTQ